jgi:hypothetical protein
MKGDNNMEIRLDDINHSAYSIYLDDKYADSYENTFCKDDTKMYVYQVQEYKKWKINRMNLKKDLEDEREELQEALMCIIHEKEEKEENYQLISDIIDINSKLKTLNEVKNYSNIELDIFAWSALEIDTKKNDSGSKDICIQTFRYNLGLLYAFLNQNSDKFNLEGLDLLRNVTWYNSFLPFEKIRLNQRFLTVNSMEIALDETVKIFKDNKKLTRDNKRNLLEILNSVCHDMKLKRSLIPIVHGVKSGSKTIPEAILLGFSIETTHGFENGFEFRNIINDYLLSDIRDIVIRINATNKLNENHIYDFIIYNHDDYYDKIEDCIKKEDYMGCVEFLCKKYEEIYNIKEDDEIEKFYKIESQKLDILKRIMNELNSQILSKQEKCDEIKNKLKKYRSFNIYDRFKCVSKMNNLRNRIKEIDQYIDEYTKSINDISEHIRLLS